MRYRIDFTGERRSMVVNNRSELLGWLKLLHPNTIEDIRKLYIRNISKVHRLIRRKEDYAKDDFDTGMAV